MLRNLYDTLRIKYAIWRYGIEKPRQRDLAVAHHAVETLHGMGQDVDVQARLRQAALLEANQVPEALVQVVCRVAAQGRFTQDEFNQIAEQGITVDLGHSLDERLYQAMQSAGNYGRIIRLQQAVKRLARIAGPGFTTDHLIDEGLIHEGDL